MNPKKPVTDGEPADDPEQGSGHEAAADAPKKESGAPMAEAAGARKPDVASKPESKPQAKPKPKAEAEREPAAKPGEAKTLADIMKFDLKIRRPRR